MTEICITCEAAVSRIQSLPRRNINIQLVWSAGDPEDLELIWVNLLENAVQYSPAGSSVVIHVGRESSGAGMRFGARFGTGIPEEQLPHVFQRFTGAILRGLGQPADSGWGWRSASHCDGVWRPDPGPSVKTGTRHRDTSGEYRSAGIRPPQRDELTRPGKPYFIPVKLHLMSWGPR